jgi:hypothetical protein
MDKHVDHLDSPNDSLDLKLLYARDSMTPSVQWLWEKHSCIQYRLELEHIQDMYSRLENEYVSESLVDRTFCYAQLLRNIDQLPSVERLYPACSFLSLDVVRRLSVKEFDENDSQDTCARSHLFQVD